MWPWLEVFSVLAKKPPSIAKRRIEKDLPAPSLGWHSRQEPTLFEHRKVIRCSTSYILGPRRVLRMLRSPHVVGAYALNTKTPSIQNNS